MYFLVHHSTGALMLNAPEKGDVMSWSERQFGNASQRVAIVEVSESPANEWVEKSGTGIYQNSCQAFLSVMADSIQAVTGSALENNFCLDLFQTNSLKCRVCSVH